MAGKEASDVPVLVVGAGPSGLLAAVELARHGIQARVVEREPVPPKQARATAVQPGTLEILAQTGVADTFLQTSVHLAFARVFNASLSPIAEMAFAGAGCQWEFQCSLPQWRTEEILADRLAELGGSVDRGAEVITIKDREEWLDVGLRRADGTAENIQASWVLGAGGAHSVTRGSMAEELAGETYPGTALVADVQVLCDLPRDGSALIASPQGYVLLAPLPDNRWITFIGDLTEGEAGILQGDLSTAAIAATLEHRVAESVRLNDVNWAATFRMHHRQAPELAAHRRFLLGDAAHLSSPFGGEGLNSGMHDGHNLAWKLALELTGHARPCLLDSYAAERGAAAKHVLGVSDRLHRLAHSAVESARTGIFSDPPTPAESAALVRSRSMLDFSYAASHLTGEYQASDWPEAAVPAPGQRYGDRASLTGTAHHLLVSGRAHEISLARLQDRWSGLVKLDRLPADPRRGGPASDWALLVRPDGYVGFRACPADAAGVAAVEAHLSSYLIPV